MGFFDDDIEFKDLYADNEMEMADKLEAEELNGWEQHTAPEFIVGNRLKMVIKRRVSEQVR